MIKCIEYKSTLMYYDGPELIEANDRIGGQYIGVALDSSKTIFNFLVVGVNPKLLHQLRRGELDLRTVVVESASDGWYLCETDNLDEPIPIQDQGIASIPDELLPNENCFISEKIDSDDVTMLEATDRDRFVLQLCIESKRYDQLHRLKLKDYGDLIAGLNSLIVSTRESDVSTPSQDERVKNELYVVTPAEPGSLRVLFEASKVDEDIFDPHRLLVRALKQIDTVINRDMDADYIKTLSSDYSAEFAKKLMKFMSILEKSEVDLRYSWAEPRFRTENSTKVSHTTAKNFVAAIKAKSSEVLFEADRTVHGCLVTVIRGSGKWGLITNSGVIEGTVDSEDRAAKLDGLTIGSEYTVECVEQQTFNQVWKDAKPTLILRNIYENRDS